MIVVVDGISAPQYQSLLKKVFELRARVFCDRLGWEVDVKDGMERDSFDDQHPTHIVSVNDAGQVVGCMRLLQTIGPNMLSDVFSSILQGQPAPRSPLIWEATRFCVDTNVLERGKTRNSISYVTSEIMVAAFEYARAAGVQDAVAVIDPVMNRVLQRSANAPYDYLGAPTPMGKVTAMAALMDCSQERITKVRDFAGIKGNIIMPDDLALTQFGDCETEPKNLAPADTANSADALAKYCAEQIAAAEGDPEEMSAALKLLAALVAKDAGETGADITVASAVTHETL